MTDKEQMRAAEAKIEELVKARAPRCRCNCCRGRCDWDCEQCRDESVVFAAGAIAERLHGLTEDDLLYADTCVEIAKVLDEAYTLGWRPKHWWQLRVGKRKQKRKEAA
jgi:hypothetical protein